jgi:hypothetical protein
MKYKDFYKELLNESMTATVAGNENPDNLQDLLRISHAYMNNLITPIFFKLSQEDQRYFRENRKAMDFFTPDGGDEFKATGTINFYTTGFKPETVETILKGVKYYASEMNIVIDDRISEPEQSQIYPNSQVIRIKVIKNNNIDNFKKVPEVQLSYANAILIFHRVLQLPDFEEGYTIAAIDLLTAITNVENKDKQDKEFLYRYSRPTSVDGIMTTGGITPKYLRGKLSELKQLCNYAIYNDITDIVIG